MISDEDIKRLFSDIETVDLPERVRAALAAPSLAVQQYKWLLQEMLERYCPERKKESPRR